MAKTAKLTERDILFCKNYIIHMKTTKAALLAGFPKRSATQQGWATLQKPLVIKYLAKIRKERDARLHLDIDADYVMRRLHEIESFDVTDLYNAEGALLDVSEWPEGAGMIIAGLTLDERKVPNGNGDYEDRITKTLKLENRTQALIQLGKLQGVNAFDTTLNLENLEGVTFNITMKD